MGASGLRGQWEARGREGRGRRRPLSQVGSMGSTESALWQGHKRKDRKRSKQEAINSSAADSEEKEASSTKERSSN